MNVLIVDDDKLARKGLIAIMDWEKYGFKVAGDVQNGRKALEFLRTHPVDIVFTDIDMPEIDGLELMQMCKEEFPDIKFVIFSVYENFSYAQTAIRMGALDYISMKAAAERIEEGGKSITQIATELGYDNFHYFARVFAREHGCNPSEYRKERKNV